MLALPKKGSTEALSRTLPAIEKAAPAWPNANNLVTGDT